MNIETLNNRLRGIKIVPVIALERAEDAVPLGRTLQKNGIPVAEITFRSAAAIDAIRRLTATQQVLAGGLTAHPMGIGPEARTLAEADVPVVVGADGYELARLLPRELLEAAPRR